MANLEREYTIPLRRECLKVPRYKRTRKAIKAVRKFVQKHMKTEDVKIGKHLNEMILEKGWKNPPPRVKVRVIKFEEKDKTYVKVNLIDAPIDEKKDEKKGWKAKIKERFAKKKVKKEAAQKLEEKVEKKKGEREVKVEERKKEEAKEKKEVLEHTQLETNKVEEKITETKIPKEETRTGASERM